MRLLLFALAIGCGSSPNKVASVTERLPDSLFLPLDWRDVEIRATGIYRGVLVDKGNAADPKTCTHARTAVRGNATKEWCGPDDQPLGVGWAPPPGKAVWIVTWMRDGVETPWAAGEDEQGVTKEIVCDALTRLPALRPADDTPCTTDADCRRIASNCWEVAVSAEREARVIAVRDRWLTTCQGAGLGGCGVSGTKAVCVANRCGLQ